MDARRCAGCDDELPARVGRGNPRKWCSEACRVRAHRERTDPKPDTKCAECGRSLAHRYRGAKYCSPQCQWRRARPLLTERQRFTCCHCGSEFDRPASTRGNRPKWCPDCRDDRVRTPERRRANAERSWRTDVFDRDGWVCGICDEPVDPSLEWPHPQRVSLDHIVPLGKGGEHTPENSRCSHLRCNCKRGDRTEDLAWLA